MKPGRFLHRSLKVDWLFLGVTFALMVCGVSLVYSATANAETPLYESFWFKQIIYFIGI